VIRLVGERRTGERGVRGTLNPYTSGRVRTQIGGSLKKTGQGTEAEKPVNIKIFKIGQKGGKFEKKIVCVQDDGPTEAPGTPLSDIVPFGPKHKGLLI